MFLDLPLGQLPVLKVDGKCFSQSEAISRFAGGRAHGTGVLPQLNEVEGIACNMISETVREVMDVMNKVAYGCFMKAEGDEKGNAFYEALRGAAPGNIHCICSGNHIFFRKLETP